MTDGSQEPQPLDYQPPQPRRRSSDTSPIVAYVGGVFFGPLILAMMIGAGTSAIRGGAGILVPVCIYVCLIGYSLWRKPGRAFGLGLICGPLLILFAIAVMCGNMKF